MQPCAASILGSQVLVLRLTLLPPPPRASIAWARSPTVRKEGTLELQQPVRTRLRPSWSALGGLQPHLVCLTI